MSWLSLGSNQTISNNNLQNGVDTSIFTLKTGQTIPANNKCLRCDEVSNLVNVALVSGGSKLVLKNQIIATSTIVDLYMYAIVNPDVLSINFSLSDSAGTIGSLQTCASDLVINFTWQEDNGIYYTDTVSFPNGSNFLNKNIVLQSGVSIISVNLNTISPTSDSTYNYNIQ
jgi:hypothetical protein